MNSCLTLADSIRYISTLIIIIIIIDSTYMHMTREELGVVAIGVGVAGLEWRGAEVERQMVWLATTHGSEP